MGRKNTMGRLEYFWDNVYWTSVMLLLYNSILFHPIVGLAYKQSAVILVVTVVIGGLAGIALTYRNRRNYSSIFSNLVLSFGLYFVLSYWYVAPKTMIIAGLLTLAAIGLYCVLVLNSYIQEKRSASHKATGWQWISTCLLRCRKIVALSLALLMIFTALQPLLGLTKTESGFDSVTAEAVTPEDKSAIISKHMDTVLLLQEEEWNKLDLTARLEVMQTIADIEANYLGIPKLNVSEEVLEESTAGSYNDAGKIIKLDRYLLSTASASAVLKTLCHECYHAYQYRLIELYDVTQGEARKLLVLRQASCYKDEFTNYIDGTEDYEGYNAQWCESDSDAYADEAVIDYYYSIHLYYEEMKGAMKE